MSEYDRVLRRLEMNMPEDQEVLLEKFKPELFLPKALRGEPAQLNPWTEEERERHRAFFEKLTDENRDELDSEYEPTRPASFENPPPQIERLDDGSVNIKKVYAALLNDYDGAPMEGNLQVRIKLDAEGHLASVDFSGRNDEEILVYTPEEIEAMFKEHPESRKLQLPFLTINDELTIIPVLTKSEEGLIGGYFSDWMDDDASTLERLNTGSRRFGEFAIPTAFPQSELQTMIHTQSAPGIFR